jgi:hypothetical protein
MVIERYVILTITLFLSAILFLAPTTTTSATINNYFNYKDEKDNEEDIYREKYKKERKKYEKEREKYKERKHRLDSLCDDPQATKKYGEICKGYGNYYKDLKDEYEDKDGKWENNRCEFDHDTEIEKQFEFEEVCEEIKDNDDLYCEICMDSD